MDALPNTILLTIVAMIARLCVRHPRRRRARFPPRQRAGSRRNPLGAGDPRRARVLARHAAAGRRSRSSSAGSRPMARSAPGRRRRVSARGVVTGRLLVAPVPAGADAGAVPAGAAAAADAGDDARRVGRRVHRHGAHEGPVALGDRDPPCRAQRAAAGGDGLRAQPGLQHRRQRGVGDRVRLAGYRPRAGAGRAGRRLPGGRGRLLADGRGARADEHGRRPHLCRGSIRAFRSVRGVSLVGRLAEARAAGGCGRGDLRGDRLHGGVRRRDRAVRSARDPAQRPPGQPLSGDVAGALAGHHRERPRRAEPADLRRALRAGSGADGGGRGGGDRHACSGCSRAISAAGWTG